MWPNVQTGRFNILNAQWQTSQYFALLRFFDYFSKNTFANLGLSKHQRELHINQIVPCILYMEAAIMHLQSQSPHKIVTSAYASVLIIIE